MKNINRIRCVDIINEVKLNLSLNDITVVFDDININEIPNKGIDSFLYFNTMDSEKEKEIYNSLSEEKKLKYKTSSCAIHYPNISAYELSSIYKNGDYTGLYDIINEMIKDLHINSYSSEIILVIFTFLHELGHWKQLAEFDYVVCDFNSHYYLDYQTEEKLSKRAEKLYEDYKEYHHLIEKLNPVDIQSLSEEEVRILEPFVFGLNRIQREYRNIPKEMEADNFAKKMLQNINLKTIIYSLTGID